MENIVIVFDVSLASLMQKAKDYKISADDSEEARHWAVLYTKLEDAYAYYQTFLVEEEE